MLKYALNDLGNARRLLDMDDWIWYDTTSRMWQEYDPLCEGREYGDSERHALGVLVVDAILEEESDCVTDGDRTRLREWARESGMIERIRAMFTIAESIELKKMYDRLHEERLVSARADS